jgi:putative aldouronate transport system permease protein
MTIAHGQNGMPGGNCMKAKFQKRDLALTLMVFPGFLFFIVFRYIPMLGIIIAFKDYRMGYGGFVQNLFRSEWTGLKNFKFLVASGDAFVAIRNTVLYNIFWIILGTILAVAVAIMLNEIAIKKLAKVYQTLMFFPFFLSWVVVSYFVFAFLSSDAGFVNNVLRSLNMETIDWYMEPGYWPAILTVVSQWKGIGYSSVIYLASICGIDNTYYEAAMIDGATKWQQMKNITLPMLVPILVVLTILSLGRIFSADFGLFFNVPMESGALFSTTSVIDTYVYRAMTTLADFGMSTAAGLAQSVAGFFLIMATNAIVKRYDSDNALL